MLQNEYVLKRFGADNADNGLLKDTYIPPIYKGPGSSRHQQRTQLNQMRSTTAQFLQRNDLSLGNAKSKHILTDTNNERAFETDLC